MQSHPYSSNTTYSQLHSQNSTQQRQMSRSEYMSVKNIPLPNPARKTLQDKEAAIHRIRLSSIPVDPNPVQHHIISHSTFGSQMSSKQQPHFGPSDAAYVSLEKEKYSLQEQLVTYATEIEHLKVQLREQIEWRQANEEKLRLYTDLDKRYKLLNQDFNQFRNKYNDERRIFEESRKSVEYFQQINEQLTIELQSFQSQQYNQSSRIDLENKVVLLAQEVERLKQQLEDKIHEVDGLRGIEKTYQQQLEEMKFRLESQSKQMFHNQFQEVNAQHQQEIYSMEEQIKSYKYRQNEMKTQMEQYISEINKCNLRYSECSKERDYNQAELQKMSREFELVKMQLGEKEKDVDALNERIRIMENKHLCEMNEMKSTFEFTKRSVCDGQMRELTMKFNQDRNSLEQQIRSLSSKIIDLENRIVLLSQENERMHFRFNEKNEELETLKSRVMALEIERQKIQAESIDWRQSYESLEHSYQNKLQELHHHFETQTQISIDNQLQLARLEFNKERGKYNNEAQLLNERNNNVLGRLLLADLEIERLLMKIKDLIEIQAKYEVKIVDIETSYRHQIEIITQEWHHKVSITSQESHSREANLIQELKASNLKCNSLEEKLAMLAQELERLNQSLLDKQKEAEMLRRSQELESRKLLSEQETLRSQLFYMESTYKKKFEETQSELQHQQKDQIKLGDKYQEVLGRLLLADLEIERLLMMIQNLLTECQNLEKGYLDAENNYRLQLDQANKNHKKELNSQLQQLANRLNLENQSLQQQYDEECRNFNRQINQLQLTINKYDEESNDLKKRLQLKEEKLAQTLQRLLMMDLEVERLNLVISEQDNSIQRLQKQWDQRYEFTVQEYDAKIQHLTNEYELNQQELMRKITLVSTERERLSVEKDRLLGERERAFSERDILTSELADITSERDQYFSDRANLAADRDRLHQERDRLAIERDRLSQHLNNSQQEVQQLLSRLQEQEEQSKQYVREIEELYTQVESYSSEMTMMQRVSIDIRDIETKFSAERSSWETLRQQLQQDLYDWENRYNQISLENKRLIKLSEEKYKEIEAWKSKYNQSSLESDFEDLQRKYNHLKDQAFEMEQARVKSNSQLLNYETQLRHLQSSLESKSKEVQDVYDLMDRKRRESDLNNKDFDHMKKNNLSLQHQIKNLEAELYQAQEFSQQHQREKEQLESHVKYLERQLEMTRDTVLQKNKELTDRIKELDLIKEKYQNQSQATIVTTTQRISTTRQSLKSTTSEQENLSDISRMKSSSSVPPQPQRTPRQAMSILNQNFD